MPNTADIKKTLDQLSTEELREVNRIAVDIIKARRRDESAARRAELAVGDVCRLENMRGQANGIRVKVTQVNRTRAYVTTLDRLGMRPPGDEISVPIACLAPCSDEVAA